MSDVFLDTVGLIATWDIRDQWHAAAEAAYQDLFRHGRQGLIRPRRHETTKRNDRGRERELRSKPFHR